jgi:hypothetical protein
MERWCCVEAKTFVFTVVEGASVVRLVERRKSYSGLVILSYQSLGWLASTMESLQWCQAEKEFIKSFREGSKVLIARRGGNAAGRFLEVAVYGVGGRRGIIYIPEGRDGRGWRTFVSVLDKISAFLKEQTRLGVARPVTVLEKPRRNGEGAIGGHDMAGSSRALSNDVTPSFADVLRSGPGSMEVERVLSQPARPLAKDCGERPEEQKLSAPNGSANPLGMDQCYRCGSELAKAKAAPAVRDKTEYAVGATSAGIQLTGELNTFSSLLNWKCHLEKLKAEVDKAFSRVCEGLIEFGPGVKPSVNGQKRKNKLKKKRRLRWVRKEPKPNVLVQKVRDVCPGEGSPPVKDLTGSDKSLEVLEFPGFVSGDLIVGSSAVSEISFSSERGPRPEDNEDSLKGDMGPIVEMGWSSKLPEVAGSPSSSLEIRVPVSASAPSVLGTGTLVPIAISGDSLIEPAVGANVLRALDDVLSLWVESGPPDPLFSSGFTSSVPMLTHSSGLGERNGLEVALLPEEEPVPLSFIDKVRECSGEKTPEGFLKAILAYSHRVGITCDGFESKLSAVFEAIIDSNVKKVAGPSSSLSIKGTRELNRLSCSVNYDAHSGSTSRGRCKGRAFGSF